MSDNICRLLAGLTVEQLKEVKKRSGIILPNVSKKEDFVYWLTYCYEEQENARVLEAAKDVMAE